MNELEQLWRERIDWVRASGLTIAAASAELGVSATSVYRWKKLLAESTVPGRHPARPSDALDSSRDVLRIVLPNGVVIQVAGDVDGERSGDVVIAAGQIPGKATAVTSCGSGATP